jgi:hypothetical protein
MQKPSGQGMNLDTIRQTVESEVLKAVDGVLGRIPNGQQHRDQFRQAISGAMDNLQQQAQGQMGNLGNLGGMLGNMTGQKRDQPNPPAH